MLSLKKCLKKLEEMRRSPRVGITEKMEKRGVVLLTFLTLSSLFWKSFPVTFGVLIGGALALGDFWLMRNLFPRLVKEGKGKGLLLVQIFKYLIMGLILGTGFFIGLVNPLAALIGLSLLVVMPLSGIWDLWREMKEVA